MKSQQYFLDRRVIDPATNCWNWTKGKFEYGHGAMRDGPGSMRQAHQCAYEAFIGPIPVGSVIRHRCNNPSCINPEHLVPGTMSDNTQDRWQHGTMRAGSESSSTKLTDTQVLLIRAEYPQKSMAQLAKEYSSNSASIFNIIHRRTWKHL